MLTVCGTMTHALLGWEAAYLLMEAGFPLLRVEGPVSDPEQWRLTLDRPFTGVEAWVAGQALPGWGLHHELPHAYFSRRFNGTWQGRWDARYPWVQVGGPRADGYYLKAPQS